MPYEYTDVVRLAISAGHARTPRLQKSATAEFGQMISHEVAAGGWPQVDGDEVINVAGQTIEQYLDHLISTRPHWEVPATVVDAADTTWLDGSLAAQGKRWKELRAFLGNDAATNAAINAEAELYGAKFGTTQKGVKPGTKPTEGEVKASPNNPWHPQYLKRHSPQEADAEKARLIGTLGTKGAASIAKAAGFSVFGAKLK
jgi:hypothetical protein